VSGQPKEFTDAVGIFRASGHLAETTVQVGQPVLFTLRVVALGKPLVRPGRPRLDKDDVIPQSFFVETPDPAEKEIDARTWSFHYLMRPRQTAVPKVPQIISPYSDPAAGQDPSGYQTSLTDDIPLKVTAAPDVPVEPTGAAGPAEVPDSVLGIEKGE